MSLPGSPSSSVGIAKVSSDSVPLSIPSLSKSKSPSGVTPSDIGFNGSVPTKASSESFTPSPSSSVSVASGIPSPSVSVGGAVRIVTVELSLSIAVPEISVISFKSGSVAVTKAELVTEPAVTSAAVIV